MSEEAVKQPIAEQPAAKPVVKPAAPADPMFTISASPHIRDGETIPHIMWQVNAALLPAAFFAVWWFGMPALVNMVVGAVVAIASEYVWQKAMHRPLTAFDGSATYINANSHPCPPIS